MDRLFTSPQTALTQLDLLKASNPTFNGLEYRLETVGKQSIITTNIATDAKQVRMADGAYWRQKSLCLIVGKEGGIQLAEIDRQVRVPGLWEPENPKNLSAIIRPLPVGLRPKLDWNPPQSPLVRLLSSFTPRKSLDADSQLNLAMVHVARIAEKTGFTKPRLPRWEKTLEPNGCVLPVPVNKVRFQPA